MALKRQKGEDDGQGSFLANLLRFTVTGEGNPLRNVDNEREAKGETCTGTKREGNWVWHTS